MKHGLGIKLWRLSFCLGSLSLILGLVFGLSGRLLAQDIQGEPDTLYCDSNVLGNPQQIKFNPDGHRWAFNAWNNEALFLSFQKDGPCNASSANALTCSSSANLTSAAKVAVRRAFNSWTGRDVDGNPLTNFCQGFNYEVAPSGGNRGYIPNLRIRYTDVDYNYRNSAADLSTATVSNFTQLEAARRNFKTVFYWHTIEATSHQRWSDVNAANTVGFSEVLLFHDTGLALGATLSFNNVNFSWRAGGYGCSSASSNCYDVYSIAIHELGHLVGLYHLDPTTCAGGERIAMQPASDGTSAVTAGLLANDRAGICALYPPRASAIPLTKSAPYEGCNQDSDCAGYNGVGTKCILSSEGPPLSWINAQLDNTTNTAPLKWGYCGNACDDDSHCPAGYICVAGGLDNGKFCRPGLRGTVNLGQGDLCIPCASASDCNKLCINIDSQNDLNVCTQYCHDNNDCPTNFSCLDLNVAGNKACFPLNTTVCSQYLQNKQAGGSLNDVCYNTNLGQVNNSAGVWDCLAPLQCVQFEENKLGFCLRYCNTKRSCSEGLTCCASLDANKNCIQLSQSTENGTCFHQTKEGQSCELAENSVCTKGNRCFKWDSGQKDAVCYHLCSADSDCASSQSCITAPDRSISICCNKNSYKSTDFTTCTPKDPPCEQEIGYACKTDDDCVSGMCLKLSNGLAACTRSCDVNTALGCPVYGNTGDSWSLQCLATNQGGRCWPVNDRVRPATTCGQAPTPTTAKSSGSCCHLLGSGGSSGEMALNTLSWLPLGLYYAFKRWRRNVKLRV